MQKKKTEINVFFPNANFYLPLLEVRVQAIWTFFFCFENYPSIFLENIRTPLAPADRLEKRTNLITNLSALKELKSLLVFFDRLDFSDRFCAPLSWCLLRRLFLFEYFRFSSLLIRLWSWLPAHRSNARPTVLSDQRRKISKSGHSTHCETNRISSLSSLPL